LDFGNVKVDAGNGSYPKCRIPVWLAQGAQDQTVDWKYNIDFVRRQFRLQTLLILEEGSHQLINERADIRAALNRINSCVFTCTIFW
jgi:alpha-beta hydrolase superfamily lysophospholipase